MSILAELMQHCISQKITIISGINGLYRMNGQTALSVRFCLWYIEYSKGANEVKSMYSVLLADDERSVLDTLKESIHWQQFGIDTVLEVNDGLQALDVIASRKIDLLITDIRMPRMDGLTLIRQIREQYPDIHCILLTAHGEFEYAREAIRLNVENYLLKPLNLEELEETIKKALDNLYHHVGARKRWEGETLFGDNILLRWLDHTISQEELSERATHLDLNLFLPQYCVICIQKKNESVVVRPFCCALREKLDMEYETNFLWDQRDHHVFILGGQDLKIEQILRLIHQTSKDFPEMDRTAISIGEIVSNPAEVSISYQGARRQLDTADLSNEGMILLVGNEGESILTDTLISQFDSLFQLQDGDERQQQTLALISSLLESMTIEDTVQLVGGALMQLFTQRLPEKQKVKRQLQSRLRMSTGAGAEDIAEMVNYAYLLYQHTISDLSPVVQRAISFIQEHYAEQISIKEYCAMCKMSTPYFGHLFKTETGMFFNNYLNQCRMCNTITLLHETDCKVNDVAERCGFTTPSYFISCFKKQMGISPAKYRAMRAKRANGKI